MRDLAPNVFRQRLLIEATYRRSLSRADVERYLTELPAVLELRTYSPPVVYSPGGDGKEANQGYDGFVALIDSGISIYVWENARFVSVVVYTCKGFDVEAALEFTEAFFETDESVHMSF